MATEYIHHPDGSGAMLGISETGATSWIRKGQSLPSGWRYVRSGESLPPLGGTIEEKLEAGAEALGVSLVLKDPDDCDEWGRKR